MKPNPLNFAWRGCLPVLLMLAAGVHAETLEQALVKRFPAGSIGSVPAANAALADVGPARREAEQQFAAERAVCLEKFFTSSCLSDAKEVRRVALSNIRKIEVEANAFLRKERAAERERAIAEREGRAARPLDGPSIPITGATRESSPATSDTDSAAPPAER